MQGMLTAVSTSPIEHHALPARVPAFSQTDVQSATNQELLAA